MLAFISTSTYCQELTQKILTHEERFVFFANDFLHFYDYNPLQDDLYLYDIYYPFAGELLLDKGKIDWDQPIFAVGKIFITDNFLLYLVRNDVSYLKGYIYSLKDAIFVDSLYLTSYFQDEEDYVRKESYIGDFNGDGDKDLIIYTDSSSNSSFTDTFKIELFHWSKNKFNKVEVSKTKKDSIIKSLLTGVTPKVNNTNIALPNQKKVQHKSICAAVNGDIEVANENLHDFRLWLINNKIPISPIRFWLKKIKTGYIIQYSTYTTKELTSLLRMLSRYKNLSFKKMK